MKTIILRLSLLLSFLIQLSICGQSSPENICGEDDRSLSFHPAVGRIWRSNYAHGTAFIISNGKLITAGHVAYAILNDQGACYAEFNVPPSSGIGTPIPADDEDRYMIKKSSLTPTTFHYNGDPESGDDWAVFEVYPNSITGLMPIDEGAQNAYIKIQQTTNLQTIRITGYGHNLDPNPTWNYRQQTATGNYFGSQDYVLKYVVDAEGGNSGSPIIDLLTGKAVGVHTFGECQTLGYNGGTSFYNPDFWNATGLGIDYTVDQIDENDERLTGTNIGRWESYSFKEYVLQNEAILFSAEENEEEVIRANQNTALEPKQKYNNWLDVSEIVNHRKVLIDDPYLFTSKFKKTYSGVTIQNNFLDAPIMNPDDDVVGFKDPWFIDYPDPDYGSNRRNRGMDISGNDALIFRDRTSPFYPNFENTFEYNQVYNGVFLNQDPQLGLPNYSVRSPVVQNIPLTQTGKYHNFYFQNWSWSGTDPLTQNNIVNGYYETPIVFRSGNATVNANLKGTQLSNNANTYKNTSQRKFIKTPDGKMYITYESINCVWLERSTDNGSTWEIMNDGKPIGNAEGISPCLDYEPDHSLVVLAYQQKIGSVYGLKYLVYNPETNNYRYGDVEWIGTPPPESIIYSHNAQIVVSWNKDNDALFVWKSTDELLYSACLLHALGTDWKISGSILYYESNYNTPTLYCNKSITSTNGIKYFHLAYQNLNSEIHYRLLTLNVSNPLDPRFTVGRYTNVSANSGYYIHYNPTILGTDNVLSQRYEYIRVSWIGYREYYPDDPSQGGSTPVGQSRVLFKSKWPSGTWSALSVYGNNVGSVSMNKCSQILDYWEPFTVGWSEWNTNYITNKYIRPLDHGPLVIRTLSTDGEELQINNSTNYFDMYVNAFKRHGSPYHFNLSESLSGGLNKIESTEILKGREGVVTKDSTDFYYSIGDMTLQGENLDFISMPDSVNINDLQIVNGYLVSEPFSVNSASTLTYSVEYGIIDSLAAVNALSYSTEINFRVEMVDYQTGEVLGVFDEVTYSSENVFQYNNIGYEVDMTGIGNRAVVLKLVVSTNADCGYSISGRFADSESLNKCGTKHLVYNETMVVKEYDLEQNYPNPFNPTTTIRYQLPKDGMVTLKVYDILGAEVATLVNEEKIAGKYEVNFDASRLASGVYIYRLNVNEYVNVKKMVLVK